MTRDARDKYLRDLRPEEQEQALRMQAALEARRAQAEKATPAPLPPRIEAPKSPPHARTEAAAPAPLPPPARTPAPRAASLPLLPEPPNADAEEAPKAAAFAEARVFLEALFSVRTPGEIMVKTKDARSEAFRRPTWHSKTEGAARSAIESADTCDVYFGVGRRIERDDRGVSVAQLGFVWADLDGNTDADIDAFIDRVTQAQLPPSMAVQTSDFGLHCYWLLKDARETADVCEVAKQLAERFRTDPAVTDAARILRVPGTRNWKAGRNGFHVRLYSAGGRWWCPEDDLSQMPRYALEDLGTPSPQARSSAPAWLPAEPMHDLLRALELDVPGARRMAYEGSYKITLRCLFHADEKPSAVVFANGRFFCSACGVNEPAGVWTKWPAARQWFDLVRAERARRKQEAKVGVGRDGFFRAPRVGIRDVGRAMLSNQSSSMRSMLWIDHDSGEQMMLGAQRSESALQPVAFDLVTEELRAYLPMAYRVLWASIVLAQQTDHGGVFPVTVPLLGRLLGYSLSNGELNHQPRQAIHNALKLLMRITAEIQWSSAKASTKARLLMPRSEERRGPLVYWTFQLHPSIHNQVVGRSPAYGHLRPEALKLEPERLAVYAEAQYEYRQHGQRRAELRLALTDIAQRAGVLLSLRRNGHRTLERWATDYGRFPRLGLEVDVSTAELVVRQQERVTVDEIEPMRRLILAAPPLPPRPEWTMNEGDGHE